MAGELHQRINGITGEPVSLHGTGTGDVSGGMMYEPLLHASGKSDRYGVLQPPPGLQPSEPASSRLSTFQKRPRLPTIPEIDSCRDIQPPPGLSNSVQDDARIEAFEQELQLKQGLQWPQQQEQGWKLLSVTTSAARPKTPNFCTFCGMPVAPMHANTRFCAYCGEEHAQLSGPRDELVWNAGWTVIKTGSNGEDGYLDAQAQAYMRVHSAAMFYQGLAACA
mmetsp:Transcript_77695/g.219692  ORF Transcript_77695/g.219692 Transcript_77695/m.219692 type:complete len:222 (-) Transcript_77695:255-920(-)